MDKIDEWFERVDKQIASVKTSNSTPAPHQGAKTPQSGANHSSANPRKEDGKFSQNRQKGRHQGGQHGRAPMHGKPQYGKSQSGKPQHGKASHPHAKPQHHGKPQHPGKFQQYGKPQHQRKPAYVHGKPAQQQHKQNPQTEHVVEPARSLPQQQQSIVQGAKKHRIKNKKGGEQKAKVLKPLSPTPILKGKLKVIPLGGLDEVGKNMMAIEYENDIIIIDMGLEFPSEDMLGIDYVIPDVTYLENNRQRIRGVFITHGHLDHIGGIPYILPKLDFPPVYGTRLTMGLVQKRCEEFKQEKIARLYVIDPDKAIKLGEFLISFARVNHSIPDAVAIIIDTPVGKIVHTGDYKFDETPARNQAPADIHKLERLGRENVLALFSESTNSLKPGHSMSEQQVGIALDKFVAETPGRLIIASFSSQIGRLQQIIDSARRHNRQIFVSGRSMTTNIEIAARLGYMDVGKDQVKDIRQYKKTPDHETLILTTGSQGESVSALSRIALNEHPHVKVKKGDTIILSSSPIVGNERAINTIINRLAILGANVVHNQLADVHTSGHGKQDELAHMINMVKPKYLVPIHGEFYMRQGLAQLAMERCNIPENRIIMLTNGDVLVAEKDRVYKSDQKIETKYILIDGSGEGTVGSQVQVDREIMSQNGAVIIILYVSRKTGSLFKRQPDVVSRGFIYMHETEEISAEISNVAADAYRNIMKKNPGATRQDIKKYVRQTVDRYTHDKLERRPLIIPLIVEM